MTQFEQAVQQAREGKLQTPVVHQWGKPIDYFFYQLSTHHFSLKVMASGMTCKGVKLGDIKRYYGLKGRTAKDCLPQFEKIMADYKTGLSNKSAE
jgi:hypothetical protein